MARDVEALVLLMDANINKFIKKMDDSEKKFDRTARNIERRQRDLDKNLAQLGAKAGDLYRPVQIGAALATGAIVALSYEAAKRAEAVNGAFSQIFRDMPEKASAATSAISTEFGRLETDIKDNFTQIGGVLAGLGVKGDQALTIIDQLQRRALDLAAFKDVADADAFAAVISGITGETEPLKRFGLVVNETATKAELLRLGFKGNAQQAPEAAKAIARANLILAKSAEIHGQVARESNTLAEQEKRTRAQFVAAAEDFGQQFLPVAAEVLEWASDALAAFNNLDSGTQNAALGLLALVAVGGPILSVIKGLKDLIATAVAARAAMLALGGASATGAAGAAGGAAAGAAGGLAGRLVAGATRAAGPVGAALLVSGDTQQRDGNLQDRINGQLAEEARLTGLINRLRSEGNEAEARRQESYQRRVKSSREVAQGLQELGRPRTPQETVEEKAREVIAGLGDFQLSKDQLSPVAGGGSGGGAGGGSGRAAAAAADRIAERREALALERAIDLARASGDERGVRAGEERQKLAQLTADYEQAGYADAKAQALEHLSLLNAATLRTEEREKAEAQVDQIIDNRKRALEREADYQQQLNDQLMDRLAMEAQLASLRGDRRVNEAKERELWIEERINELLHLRPELTKDDARGVAQGEADALDAATTQGRFRELVVRAGQDFKGLTESAGDAFKRKALEGLADQLLNIINASFGGKGSGFIKDLLNYIPGFAAGTNSAPGGLAYVHKGEVLANLPKGTSVIPGHAVRAMGALMGAQNAMASANRVRGGGVADVRLTVEASPYFDVAAQQANAGAVRQAEDRATQRGAVGGAEIVSATSQRQQRMLRAYKS